MYIDQHRSILLLHLLINALLTQRSRVLIDTFKLSALKFIMTLRILIMYNKKQDLSKDVKGVHMPK